jgi:hypothetical protein
MYMYIGTGLEEGSKEAYDDQFRPPHTGIVYFPPDYSDHVGVSIVIGITTPVSPLVISTDPATRKTQPHSLQSTMTSHFTKNPATISSNTISAVSSRSKDQTSSSSSVLIKGDSSSSIGSKKQEPFLKHVIKANGASFFTSTSSSSSSSSSNSFTSSEGNTSIEDYSSLISISTSEVKSLPPTVSSTSTSLSSCGVQHVRVSTSHSLPSTSSLSLPPPPFSSASNVSLKSKPKGKNEPAKKKSKITVVGKNGINAVKITSFFPK